MNNHHAHAATFAILKLVFLVVMACTLIVTVLRIVGLCISAVLRNTIGARQWPL